MNIELLAESELSGQAIVFIIVMIFSFLKWLYENLTKKSSSTDQEDTAELEALYEQYREEIQQRQSIVTPPPLNNAPEKQTVSINSTSTPPPMPAVEPAAAPPLAYSQEDIERARILKESVALASPPSISVKKKRKQQAIVTGGLKQQLRDHQSLRNAIILQEVLSPPKALQDS